MKRKNVYYYSRFFSTILILNCAVICVINDIFEYIIVPQKKKNKKKSPNFNEKSVTNFSIWGSEKMNCWIILQIQNGCLVGKQKAKFIYFLSYFFLKWKEKKKKKKEKFQMKFLKIKIRLWFSLKSNQEVVHFPFPSPI